MARRLRPIAALWTLAFALFTVLGAIAYARVLSHDGSSHWLLPVLTPGAGLYVFLVGSLLFGRGFGQAGDAAVFVGGSAAAWASLLVAVILVVRVVASTLRAPRRPQGLREGPVILSAQHRSIAAAHRSNFGAQLAPHWNNPEPAMDACLRRRGIQQSPAPRYTLAASHGLLPSL
ncbi:hypothetical protein [Synechococcus sp. ATX 2A4]|uniref:hypothetical protein n=1 Tax=Synechococcus sp. ATX 2A4 TaxID=2823727 RepID=UPI0020CEC742|nr:hypothetical protein [Synechococcus sp. ATX 2A4]